MNPRNMIRGKTSKLNFKHQKRVKASSSASNRCEFRDSRDCDRTAVLKNSLVQFIEDLTVANVTNIGDLTSAGNFLKTSVKL